MKLKYITIFFFIALIILAPSLSLAQEEQIDTTEEYAKFLQKPETFGLGGFFSIADKVGWGFVKAFEIMTTNFSSFITGWVLRLSTSFLEWTVNPGIESITGQQFVIQGVLITRSIANLVLIGILLIISIATIIGIESYGIRKALPMLIGVALLINFSSVITGIIIDIGQVPLEFFTEKAFPPDFSIGEAFQKSLHLSAISPGFFKDFTTLSALGNFAVSLITIAIGLAASFMFFKLGILLLLRYVAFWILTILAPFVFAISVFPSTRKYLIKWFMHLFEWSFLGIIATFFIYLALLVLVSFDISATSVFNEKIGKGGGFMGNFGITILSLFTVYFFLQYGYNMSKKMAGEGAMAIVNGIGNLMKSGALMAATGGLGAGALLGKEALKRTIGTFVKQKPGEDKTRAEKGAQKMRNMGAYLQTNRMFSRIGGNRLGQFMMGEQGLTEKEQKEAMAKKTAWKIRIENMNPKEREATITKLLDNSTLKRTDKIALAYEATEKGLLNNKSVVLVGKLAKLDEKLNTRVQEKYGHIVNSINAAGDIDVDKMNKYLGENRNDISKLNLTTLDLINKTHQNALDSIILKMDGKTLSDMSVRNPESTKIIQQEINYIARSNKLKAPIISNIAKSNNKTEDDVRETINLLNTQNTLMGPTVRFTREVKEKLTRDGGIV